MDGLGCVEKTMREVMRGGIIYCGSFNDGVLSLFNELGQAITVLYGDNYQTEHQEASILDSADPTLDQHDLQIQAHIYTYTLFAVTKNEADVFRKITLFENSLYFDIQVND